MRHMFSFGGRGEAALPVYSKEEERVVFQRLHDLGYYDSSDDSGAGSAISSLSNAAATLGSAYIIAQSRNNAVQAPQLARPQYPAAIGGGGVSSTTLLLIVGGLVILGGLFYMVAGRG